jgi:hypothetical protein
VASSLTESYEIMPNTENVVRRFLAATADYQKGHYARAPKDWGTDKLVLYGPFPDYLSAATASATSIPYSEFRGRTQSDSHNANHGELFRIFGKLKYEYSPSELAAMVEDPPSYGYKSVKVYPGSKLKQHASWKAGEWKIDNAVFYPGEAKNIREVIQYHLDRLND